MEHVRVEVADRIALVTLDRPPVNALSEQTFLEIAEAFDGLSSGRDATVAILAAAGDRGLLRRRRPQSTPPSGTGPTAGARRAARRSTPGSRSTPAGWSATPSMPSTSAACP